MLEARVTDFEGLRFARRRQYKHTPEELASFDQQITEHRTEVAALKSENKELSAKLKDLQEGLSVPEIDAQLLSLDEAISQAEAEVASLKAQGTVTEAEKAALQQQLHSNQQEERRRHKICREMLDTIADLLEQPTRKVKELVEFQDPLNC